MCKLYRNGVHAFCVRVFSVFSMSLLGSTNSPSMREEKERFVLFISS